MSWLERRGHQSSQGTQPFLTCFGEVLNLALQIDTCTNNLRMLWVDIYIYIYVYMYIDIFLTLDTQRIHLTGCLTPEKGSEFLSLMSRLNVKCQ